MAAALRTADFALGRHKLEHRHEPQPEDFNISMACRHLRTISGPLEITIGAAPSWTMILHWDGSQWSIVKSPHLGMHDIQCVGRLGEGRLDGGKRQ